MHCDFTRNTSTLTVILSHIFSGCSAAQRNAILMTALKYDSPLMLHQCSLSIRICVSRTTSLGSVSLHSTAARSIHFDPRSDLKKNEVPSNNSISDSMRIFKSAIRYVLVLRRECQNPRPSPPSTMTLNPCRRHLKAASGKLSLLKEDVVSLLFSTRSVIIESTVTMRRSASFL